MIKKTIFLSVIIFLFNDTVNAETNIVVSDFYNHSDVYKIDSWERTIPDLLQTELSKYEDVTILERGKLEALFKEHELALGGFTDSASVKKIGNLAGADFILSGSINKIDGRYRIKVNITRVKTGEVSIEIAEAHSSQYLNKMVELLAANIHFRLSGEGEYIPKIVLSKYPVTWAAVTTTGFGIAAYMFNKRYHEKYDAYKNESSLDQFDHLYDEAKTARTTAWVMGGLGAAALTATIYFLVQNSKIKNITAYSEQKIGLVPNFWLNHKNEVILSVEINF